ncbi:uncharacterized protein LOC113508189 [Trichoplusia ni]|uniref:Uncharacterized protein LOC113508189 n=1 Tax=Trichoplusia ni TaxID=7111 RepID=A0A7E5X3D8_TRINI|nr:uncharacterized protein LOC113508189 [Trichoplusia ni]
MSRLPLQNAENRKLTLQYAPQISIDNQQIISPGELGNVTHRKRTTNPINDSTSSDDLSLLGDTLHPDENKSTKITNTQSENLLQNLSQVIIARLKENNEAIISELRSTIQTEINKAIAKLTEDFEQKTNYLSKQNDQRKLELEKVDTKIENLIKENEKLEKEISEIKAKSATPVIKCTASNSKKIVLYGLTEYSKESEVDLHDRDQLTVGGGKKPGEGAPPSAQPTTAGSKGESWATVVGRKKARKAAKADSAAARAPGPTPRAKVATQPARRTAKGGRKGPTVRAPRSEAVTLTLQPGAAERGVTYQSVIAEAKAKIKLSDLGLQSVTVRQTVTGARLFEVAGAASGSAEKADALAAKMREVLNPEDVRVSRPVKTAEVRITGLDDSVTPEEVVAAVARSGECPPDRVRAGDIRTDATGLGAVWVRCPVASAKKIAVAGEVKVGWVAARVKLLQPRALRCFRCLEKGHVRAKCTSAADRSDLCYRCGQPGHKAAQCSAALNCCLCSAAGKPAGHRLGGGACGMPTSTAKKAGKRSSKPAGGNINHSARAQDLLLQTMAEWSIDVAVVAEPYFVPARDNWLGCADGSVAIIGGTLIDPSRGRGWVAAVSDGIAVVGAYFSPNKSLADFEGFLVELGAVVNRYHPRPVLVLGDLNAKSSAWGSPVTDSRGEVLEEWAVTTGLVILNRGSEYTCVRQRGGSIVDVSFASPSVAGRVRDWRVAVEVETLSDHRYIRFDVSAQTANGRHPTTPINDGPRWALKRIDRELLEEAALVQSWIWESATDGPVDVEAVALWFRGAMTQICDASMPRVSQRSARRRVYWWTDEIARLRVECVAARRRYTRYRRRRRRDPVEEGALYEVYRASKETLWLAIGDSKSRAREELLGSLDRDPWGRPYRWGMQPQLLEAVVSALFPERTGHVPPAMASPSATDSPDEESTDVPEVTQEETRAAVSRLRAKNTAPGPDGVPGRALVLALKELEPQLRGLFTACLERGSVSQFVEGGEAGPAQKGGAPRGLAVRIPAHSAARRGGQTVRANHRRSPRQPLVQRGAGPGRQPVWFSSGALPP